MFLQWYDSYMLIIDSAKKLIRLLFEESKFWIYSQSEKKIIIKRKNHRLHWKLPLLMIELGEKESITPATDNVVPQQPNSTEIVFILSDDGLFVCFFFFWY